MKLSPTIIVDSREQLPLVFPHLRSRVATLSVGDYSVVGLEHLLRIERKQIDDLAACVTKERPRFVRELEALAGFRFKMLLIEATASDLESGTWRSRVIPASVYGSVLAWTARYGLPCWLAGDHDAAGRWVERYCWQVARIVANEVQNCRAFIEDATAPTPRRTKARATLVLPEPGALEETLAGQEAVTA